MPGAWDSYESQEASRAHERAAHSAHLLHGVECGSLPSRSCIDMDMSTLSDQLKRHKGRIKISFMSGDKEMGNSKKQEKKRRKGKQRGVEESTDVGQSFFIRVPLSQREISPLPEKREMTFRNVNTALNLERSGNLRLRYRHVMYGLLKSQDYTK